MQNPELVKEMEQAYSQLIEIVKEYFKKKCITIDLDKLCMDKKTCNYLKETGIQVVEHLIAQPKLTVTLAEIRELSARLRDTSRQSLYETKLKRWLESKGFVIIG